MITAPKLTSRLVGLPFAEARKIVENELRLTVEVQNETPHHVKYWINAGPTKIRWLWITASAITGDVVKVKATYRTP